MSVWDRDLSKPRRDEFALNTIFPNSSAFGMKDRTRQLDAVDHVKTVSR